MKNCSMYAGVQCTQVFNLTGSTVYIYVCVCMCMFAYTCVCACVCVCLCMRIHVCVCVCMRIHECVYLSHDWQNSRLLIGQLAYDMKLY